MVPKGPEVKVYLKVKCVDFQEWQATQWPDRFIFSIHFKST